MKKSDFKHLIKLLLLFQILLSAILVSCTNEPDSHTLSSEAELKSFYFEAKNNPGLDKNIYGEIKAHEIIVLVPTGTDLSNLVATFEFSGESVKISDTEQQSELSKNDFKTSLIYSVFAEDGRRYDYKVAVYHIKGETPKVYINTENGRDVVVKEEYINMEMKIEDPDNFYSNEITTEYNGRIRGRGNSTWGQPKKPYRVKLDKKASLLGMTVDKDWVLLANHFDKTLLRNITAFEISRIVDMDWTPQSISVDFYFNDKYLGVYGLTEKIEVSDVRVDLSIVRPEDNSGEAVTGDYLLELDFHYDEEYKFKTNIKHLPIMFKNPKSPTNDQFNYVRDYFNHAENILYSENYRDKENGYAKYIDVESFIKYYIVQELAKNVDGNMRGSCYLALKKNGKIKQPLVWDFDIAFGNAEHIVWEQGASSVGWDGWFIKTRSPWFDRFFEDPDFVLQLKKRWNELYPELQRLPEFIKKEAYFLEEAQQRNFASRALGGAGWDIKAVMWPNNINRGSYQAELYYLVEFVERRLIWLNQNINAL